MKKLIALLSVCSGIAFNAAAIPDLQLDASPATYNGTVEATISTASTFTLYALLDSLTPGAGNYYISAAIVPMTSTAGNLGSFKFNGTTVQVTSGMQYGGPSGLPTHGIYPTYWTQFAVNWNTANKADAYDVSLVGGNHTGPTADSNGGMLYMPFTVDVAGLAAGYTLWFDLYELDANGNLIEKAPFSHAAATGGTVPDSASTLILLGVALVGVEKVRRSFKTA